MTEDTKKYKNLWLKARFDLADFLSWTYDKNPALFNFVSSKASNIEQELTTHFFNLKYREKMLRHCGYSSSSFSPEEQLEINQSFYEISLYCHSLLEDTSREWLYQRGVTDQQILKHKLGCNVAYNPLVAQLKAGVFNNCFFYPPLIEMEPVKEYFSKKTMPVATFPFFTVDGTSVTNLCCRILDDDYTEVFKFFFSHGRTSLFNVNNIDLTKPFFIFEGVFDTLTAERFGIPSVALGSSSVSDEQLEFLIQYPHAILCLDGDIAGQMGMEHLQFRKHRLPKGKDPDDLLTSTPEYANELRARLVNQ
jgi:hypothetical protein